MPGRPVNARPSDDAHRRASLCSISSSGSSPPEQVSDRVLPESANRLSTHRSSEDSLFSPTGSCVDSHIGGWGSPSSPGLGSVHLNANSNSRANSPSLDTRQRNSSCSSSINEHAQYSPQSSTFPQRNRRPSTMSHQEGMSDYESDHGGISGSTSNIPGGTVPPQQLPEQNFVDSFTKAALPTLVQLSLALGNNQGAETNIDVTAALVGVRLLCCPQNIAVGNSPTRTIKSWATFKLNMPNPNDVPIFKPLHDTVSHLVDKAATELVVVHDLSKDTKEEQPHQQRSESRNNATNTPNELWPTNENYTTSQTQSSQHKHKPSPTDSLVLFPLTSANGVLVLRYIPGFIPSPTPTNSILQRAMIQMVTVSLNTTWQQAQELDQQAAEHRTTAALLEIARAAQENFGNGVSSSKAPVVEFSEVVARLIKVTYRVIGVERVSLFLCDRTKRELWCAISQESVRSGDLRIPYGQGIAGTVAETGKLMNVPDCSVHPNFDSRMDRITTFRTRSMISCPIFDPYNGGQVIAVLQVMNKKRGWEPQHSSLPVSSDASQATSPEAVGRGRRAQSTVVPPPMTQGQEEEEDGDYTQRRKSLTGSTTSAPRFYRHNSNPRLTIILPEDEDDDDDLEDEDNELGNRQSVFTRPTINCISSSSPTAAPSNNTGNGSLGSHIPETPGSGYDAGNGFLGSKHIPETSGSGDSLNTAPAVASEPRPYSNRTNHPVPNSSCLDGGVQPQRFQYHQGNNQQEFRSGRGVNRSNSYSGPGLSRSNSCSVPSLSSLSIPTSTLTTPRARNATRNASTVCAFEEYEPACWPPTPRRNDGGDTVGTDEKFNGDNSSNNNAVITTVDNRTTQPTLISTQAPAPPSPKPDSTQVPRFDPLIRRPVSAPSRNNETVHTNVYSNTASPLLHPATVPTTDLKGEYPAYRPSAPSLHRSVSSTDYPHGLNEHGGLGLQHALFERRNSVRGGDFLPSSPLSSPFSSPNTPLPSGSRTGSGLSNDAQSQVNILPFNKNDEHLVEAISHEMAKILCHQTPMASVARVRADMLSVRRRSSSKIVLASLLSTFTPVESNDECGTNPNEHGSNHVKQRLQQKRYHHTRGSGRMGSGGARGVQRVRAMHSRGGSLASGAMMGREHNVGSRGVNESSALRDSIESGGHARQELPTFGGSLNNPESNKSETLMESRHALRNTQHSPTQFASLPRPTTSPLERNITYNNNSVYKNMPHGDNIRFLPNDDAIRPVHDHRRKEDAIRREQVPEENPTTTTADVLMAMLQESERQNLLSAMNQNHYLDVAAKHNRRPTFFVSALVLLFISKLSHKRNQTIARKLSQTIAANKPSTKMHQAFKKFFFNVFNLGAGVGNALVVRALTEIGAGVLSVRRLNAFVSALHGGYRSDCAYHNWDHALNVFQGCYAIVQQTDVGRRVFVDLDQISLLVSALGHDVGHRGRSNDFEKATLSELAVTYNDRSVLEQFHAAQTFRAMQHDACNILELMSRDHVLHVRRAVIDAIIATDMSVHVTHLNRFSQRSFAKSGLGKDDDPHEVLAFVLHAVDMGGQCSPPEQSKVWSDRVLKEFADQAREEAELGLPRTPHLQHLNRPIKQAELQANFISYIVAPMWDIMIIMMPELKPFKTNLEMNRQSFEKMKEECIAATAAATAVAASAAVAAPTSVKALPPHTVTANMLVASGVDVKDAYNASETGSSSDGSTEEEEETSATSISSTPIAVAVARSHEIANAKRKSELLVKNVKQHDEFVSEQDVYERVNVQQHAEFAHVKQRDEGVNVKQPNERIKGSTGAVNVIPKSPEGVVNDMLNNENNDDEQSDDVDVDNMPSNEGDGAHEKVDRIERSLTPVVDIAVGVDDRTTASTSSA